MSSLFNFLFSYQYEKYLNIDYEVDSRVSPKELIKQLENSKIRSKFITSMNKPSENPYRIIRKLHLCCLLILNSDNFYQLVLNDIKISVSKDKFINKQFTQPFHMFLRKCCSCSDLYNQTKKVSFNDNNYQLLFFLINLFSILFKTINKISLLGKFYKKQNTPVMQGAIEMIAIQSKQLYFAFKSLLSIILSDPKQYIKTKEQQVMIKGILIQDLATINERMKQVLLYKQFYPYGKSIGIKLFRIQETPQHLESTIRGIMTDHMRTNRRIQRQQIQDQLFNNQQGFNIQFFQETLLSGGRDNILRGLNKKNNREVFNQKQSQIVLSQHSQSDSEQQNDFISEPKNHQFSEINIKIQRNSSEIWEQDSEAMDQDIDLDGTNYCQSNATKDSISPSRTPMSYSGNLQVFPHPHQPVFIKAPTNLSKTENGKANQKGINDLLQHIQKKKGDTQ